MSSRSQGKFGETNGGADGNGPELPEAPSATCAGSGPLAVGQRWSVGRKREVVLRLLRGESVDALSRELGVEVYRLEEWRTKVLSGIDASLRERGGDPLKGELDSAMKRIGELSMENELLWRKTRKAGPLARGRSSR